MTPDWFNSAIIYQILIDRFSAPEDSDAFTPTFCGGSINGITQKLDYIQGLGINTIWISPFNTGEGYHGYHITDFFGVDQRFGTEQDLKDLIDEVHSRGMYIIADYVPNHCSREHPLFKDAASNPKSLHRDWFYFTEWPDQYLAFLGFDELVKFNLNNPDAAKHLIDAALYWLELGLDGYRIDHVLGPAPSFWKKLEEAVKPRFPEAVLFGEALMMGIHLKDLKTLEMKNKLFAWLSRPLTQHYIMKAFEGKMDGVLDFELHSLLHRYAVDKIDLKKAEKLALKNIRSFPEGFTLPTFLDNHDMDRYLYCCDNDVEKLKAAATLQFKLPSPPIIYYGTEIGMTQKHSIDFHAEHGDLEARQPFAWSKRSEEILEFYRQLISTRNPL